MVMTVLEAQVEVSRAGDLEREYREGTMQIPPEILQTFLVRDTRDATRYRIVTIWETRAGLDAMRASGVTPKGVQIFQAAGATPELSVFDIIVQQGM
jgi:hypothetical protein